MKDVVCELLGHAESDMVEKMVSSYKNKKIPEFWEAVHSYDQLQDMRQRVCPLKMLKDLEE